MSHIFLDCEWTLDGKIFLIGYAFKNGKSGNILGRQLNPTFIKRFFKPITTIYVYGPDIAYLEKNFHLGFKENFNCINMLRLVKLFIKGLDRYNLDRIEKRLGIRRQRNKYRTSIFTIWRDWNDLIKRQHVLEYNRDDAQNLREVYYKLDAKFHIQKHHLIKCKF